MNRTFGKGIPTHFLSIPIKPNDKILEFLQFCKNNNIRHSACLSPNALHITLELFSMKNEDAIKRVKSILSSSIHFNPFEIHLRCLSVLKGKERMAKVLVTKPVDNETLWQLINDIHSKCLDISIPEFNRIPHVTLINSKYTRDYKYNFDATDLFTHFGNDFDFGLFQIKEIRLCEMGLKKGPKGMNEEDLHYKSILNISAEEEKK
jgi:2'-5' RNA ligase